MVVLRWVFLGLYVAATGGLVALCVSDEVAVGAVLDIILLVSQALFILGAGTIRLCRPIRKRRLWMPVLVAAFMLTVLVFGLVLALGELTKIEERMGDVEEPWGAILFWGLLGVSWVGWGVLLWVHTRRRPRIQVLRRLTGILFGGSLLELLAAVPSHLIVIRRPGCLVGLSTMLGIVAGIYVMLFAFGPAILLLFLRPRLRHERAEEARAGASAQE